MPTTDKRKKKTDNSKKVQEAERARAFSEARRKGADAGKARTEAPRQERESETGHKIGVGVEVVTHGVELAAELAGAEGLALGTGTAGALATGLVGGYDFVKAHGKMVDKNARALQRNTMYWAASIVGGIAGNKESPWAKEGKHLSPGELKELTNQRHGDRIAGQMPTEYVGLSHGGTAERLQNEVYSQVASDFNKLLDQYQNPKLRQAAVKGYKDSVQHSIEEQRATTTADAMKKQKIPQQTPPQPAQ